ncbi:ATP-binding protein [Bacillus sp. PAMC26568]|nr:ATP-binding protein [Bacillus sp. PAMC26568]
MPKTLQNNMVLTSNYCEKHTYIKSGQEHVKKIKMMIINNKEVCPRCESEKLEEELRLEVQKKHDEAFEKRKYNTLFSKSILDDNTILLATLDNYQATEKEEIENKRICFDIVERLKKGQVFNVFLQGVQGAGKSHLGYSMLQALNESGLDFSCLYVNAEVMLRLIKDSFNNHESKYSEQYFVDLLSSVDFLVLDDIGAETGAIDTNKTATDFVQRILYAVTSSRQDKVTITTTNLSSATLFSMYDKKLVSRLLRNPKYVIFKETKDKRMSNIPF